MPPGTRTSEEEWARLKPFIAREYLENRRSVNAVRQLLRIHFGITDISIRQLKSRFQAWGWPKKIKGDDYAAMYRVSQDLGTRIVFIVPLMAGYGMKHVDGKTLAKQVNRMHGTAVKEGKPPLIIPDVDAAYEKLKQSGIRIQHEHTARADQTLYNDARSVNIDQEDNENNADDDDDEDEDDSTEDEPMADTHIIEDSSRELNTQNFLPELRLVQCQSISSGVEDLNRPRKTAVLPFAAAYLADLHCSIFPDTPEYKLAKPSTTIVRHHEGNVRVVSDSEFVANDYTDDLGLNSNTELPVSQRAFLGKLIEQTMTEYYHRLDRNGHKRAALEFSAYYVGQVLAGNETPDDYNHPDRRGARDRLCDLLEHKNMQLLPHCYWISSVIMSYDKIQQLLAFYEDCIDCITSSRSYLGDILRPWIWFMILSHRPHYNHYAVRSPRLSPAALEQMNQSFDASQALKESINRLSEHGLAASHTCLILRLYHAWNRYDQQDPIGGLNELLACRQDAEGIFGPGHLVTINCWSMIAKAYEKSGLAGIAECDFKIALSRFRLCSEMLRARYCQLSLSTAQLLLADGQIDEARTRLEEVLLFRKRRLGVQAPPTWEAAEILFDTMHRQGYGLEAQRRRAELKAHYDEEWQRHPISYIPRH